MYCSHGNYGSRQHHKLHYGTDIRRSAYHQTYRTYHETHGAYYCAH